MSILKLTAIEIKKLKRLKINTVGLLCVVLSMAISCFQMLAMSNSERQFSVLEEATIWNNVTLLMPFTIALIGGYYINREFVDDTQKNILMIPIEWKMIIKAKIVLLFLFSALLGIAEWVMCIVVSIICGCKGINLETVLCSLVYMIFVHICIVIAVLPIILIASSKEGAYIWGALLSMILGLLVVFINNGKGVNFYPLTVGLVIIQFKQIPEEFLNWKISFISLMVLILASYVIYHMKYKKRIGCY